MAGAGTGALGWGVIGCGDVVEHKSGPSIGAAGRSRMVLVMRRDAAAARDFARRHGVAKWTGDAGAVIGSDQVDVVYVATPPSSHLQYVRAAAAAGKHVLVEKPMALNESEAHLMVAACAEAGVELFVAYYRRFQPHVLRMKELLAAGAVGHPAHGCADIAVGSAARAIAAGVRPWRADPAVGGGGWFVDMASHRIDLLVWLLGPVADAVGVAARYQPDLAVEQSGVAAMRMRGGALCSVSADFHSGRDADRFAIHGECGSLTADPLDGHVVTLATAAATEKIRCAPFPAPHVGLIRHVEEVLLDGACNQASGADGMITEMVLDRAVRGAAAMVRQ
ncbi:MAG: Gfo/Idh/MocA family oxidoreductase [Spirochaetaceae bacterium]|nr:Gfo/Idh/MocA family oxidoreductase [Spirochaetaceae bacterium]